MRFQNCSLDYYLKTEISKPEVLVILRRPGL